MNILETILFETNSIKIAESHAPFWYTSGTLGPYFINTHFLYGGESNAQELLNFINSHKDTPATFLPALTDKVLKFYEDNPIFQKTIDYFYEKLKSIKEFQQCTYISGGERRDWFFSPIIAKLSNKKHLYIYKDLTVYLNNKPVTDLNNADVCHICDLVTKASSHNRAWLPAIKNINGSIIFNASVVDRDEGGKDFFNEQSVKHYSCVTIDDNFLEKILSHNVINKAQVDLIKNFKKDPQKFGENFITQNPGYLKWSLTDDSVKSKAERCVNENPYGLDFETLLK